MSNSFSKEERVAFEKVLEGFEDALVMSKNVNTMTLDQTSMERSGDTIWIPQPYIANSYDGMDQTANFGDATQMSVPARIGYSKSSPWTMNAKELRDALQSERLGQAAKDKLASDINIAIMNVAATQGTLIVKRTQGSSGFDDLALAEAIMNEQGVPHGDRFISLSTRDYNGMASNLIGLNRSFGNAMTDNAYEKAYVGRVASFELFKLDYAKRIAAAQGGTGLTVNTLTAGAAWWVPKATSTSPSGETGNVDNRYQTIPVSSTTGVAAGDCFTIAGVNAVHHITKEDTGQLKTFRVMQVLTANAMVISPPIISAQGNSDAERQYQNVVVTPSATAAISFLNTVSASANPFWHKDAFELIPGRYSVPSDAGAAIMRSTTENGIELVMQKWYDINTMKTKFRVDVLFGVVCTQPEMAGLLLFNQN